MQHKRLYINIYKDGSAGNRWTSRKAAERMRGSNAAYMLVVSCEEKSSRSLP